MMMWQRNGMKRPTHGDTLGDETLGLDYIFTSTSYPGTTLWLGLGKADSCDATNWQNDSPEV
jgi:hypothetical protein